jgi:hypothetical protein
MPARPEGLGDGTIGRKEPLGLSWRREPLHAPRPLAGGLMGVLGVVVHVARLTMCSTREYLAFRRAVAFQPPCPGQPLDWLVAYVAPSRRHGP